MIYKEISGEEYWKLRERTGAYLVLSFNYKVWYLNGKRYGTEEEWQVALEELWVKEIKDLVV